MKLKTLVAALAIGVMFSSCVVAHTAVVTNNPVGSKVGVVEGTPFKKDLDLSYQAAKEKGDISKVGIAEFKMTTMLIIPKLKLTVTGE
ncbi:hypothetical protein OAD66_01880 [Bacteroidia bacterium]|nr:hypothetical protein [Bacteroidia bacterium]MDB9881862.1 hypothetical protein [Bacteroidia bacterium]